MKFKNTFLALLSLSLLTLTACAPMDDTTNSDDNTQENTLIEDVTELTINDLTVGDGDEATAGDSISVHYVGTLLDGTKFDSSRDRGQPFSFQLGAGYVIQGWDEGVQGMKVGGLRQLIIPADMAYGDQAVGSIPAGSTLVFEVELLSID